MTRVVLDIETNAIENPDKLWCIVTQDLDTGEVQQYDSVFEDFIENAKEFTLVVGHNIIGYDLHHLNRLLGWGYQGKVHDTLILSQLLKYELEGGHSLEAWGTRLKHPKHEFNDFSKFSDNMLEYCINDVALNVKLYEWLMAKLKPEVFNKAIEVEHEVAKILRKTKDGGFPFDIEKMYALRKEIEARVEELDRLILGSFPPKFYSLGEYIPRLTKHGTISRSNLRWYAGTDYSVFSPDCPLTRLGVEPFNPGSPKQIVTRLTDNDWWDPIERTNGYTEASRARSNRSASADERRVAEDKMGRLDKYGWKVSETNLSTLRSTELEEAWVNKCQVLIPNTTKNTINEIKKRKDGQPLSTIMLTLDDLNPKLSKEITELISTSLSKWLQNKMDAAQFVEKEKNLWSITVTPEDTLEVYYVGCVTGTSDGSNVTQIARKRISEIAAARLLVERLALGNRLSTFDTWEKHYNQNTKSLHCSIDGIGTWTHRCAHRNPNLANIAAPKSIKYKTPELAAKVTRLGGRMRELFHAGYLNEWQVGTDAEGIQLRLFSHYCGDKALIKANVEGDKKQKTDIHSLNQQALGSVCNDRDTAKTFIYAFLLGAGINKVAQIFGCTKQQAQQAVDKFINAYPGLAKLKKEVIPRDARRGYFEGLDGRYVVCNSDHLMMAGYLQTGESVIMKHAMVHWHKEIKNDIDYRLLMFSHDEWQTAVLGTKNEAEHVAKVQRESIAWAGKELGCVCPLAGASSVGRNWLECH